MPEKEDNPPNYREVNNCASCKYGEVDWETVWCKKYYGGGAHGFICDDYENDD